MMQSVRRIAFRPTPAPASILPLPVRSVGHYIVRADHREPVRKRWFYQVFWCVAGEGRFFWRGAWHVLRPGMVFVYFPSEVHRIERLSESWEYHWFTTDGNNVGLWLRDCGIGDRQIPVGKCPVDLFARLEESIEDNTAAGERRCSEVAYAILLAMHAGGRSPVSAKDSPRQVRDAIDSHFMDGGLTVDGLADRHGIHRSTLYRQFRHSFGITPVRYLRHRRTQRAMSLLQETSLPIVEVAQLSGFNSNVYFCEVIRRATGLSPRQFREQGLTGGPPAK